MPTEGDAFARSGPFTHPLGVRNGVSSSSAARIRTTAEEGRVAAWTTAEKAVCAGLLVVMGAGLHVLPGVSVGTLVALLLAPLWVRSAARYRYTTPLAILFGAAIVSGLWLANLARPFHTVVRTGQVLNVGTLVGAFVAVGVFLWARRILPVWAVGAFYGGGLLLAVRTDGNFGVSPWRFGFATPVTLIVLSLALRSSRRWMEVVAACALAGASAVAGGRSPAAILVLVAVLVGWQHLRPARSRRAASARVTLMVAAIGYATYTLGQSVILDGLLGEAARDRTQLQLQQSGNLFVGGRPEMAATVALMRHFPTGFGLGVVPNSSEILVAKEGLAGVNYNPNNGYVETYMFGSSFVLHSTLGELWAWLGVLGFVLGVVVVVVVAARVISAVSARRASALMLFPALLTIWNMFFSPTLTSASIAALCLGLLLERRPPRVPEDAAEPPPERAAAGPFSPSARHRPRGIMASRLEGRAADGTA